MHAQQAVPLQHSPAQAAGSATWASVQKTDPSEIRNSVSEIRAVRTGELPGTFECRTDEQLPWKQGATPQVAEDAPVLWGQDSQDRQSSA